MIYFHRTLQPHVIIHCAAERKPDAFEKDPKKSMFLNVETTRNLAELAGKREKRRNVDEIYSIVFS